MSELRVLGKAGTKGLWKHFKEAAGFGGVVPPPAATMKKRVGAGASAKRS
jgi:hypothetical protein